MKCIKKAGMIILGSISLLLTGCKGPEWLSWLPWITVEEEKSDFEVTCSISYAKDGDREEMYDTTVFEINTRIYVCVDFTIKKNSANPVENIDFVVQIPYAEYYSTKDYYQGTIKPKENPKSAQDLHGNTYTIMELTDMTFIIDDNFDHAYKYIFEIEANQVCENAEFISRFEPENRNLSIAVNGDKTDTACRGKYSFREVTE